MQYSTCPFLSMVDEKESPAEDNRAEYSPARLLST